MGLKRWTGSGYADVNLAKYDASAVPKNAYVWDGSAYKKVWPDFSYPISGSWEPMSQGNKWVLVGSHTIQQAGSFTITHSSTNVGGYSFGTSQARIVGPWGTSTSSYNTKTATMTTTRTLAVGDVVEFWQSGYNGSTFSGTWSITKN